MAGSRICGVLLLVAIGSGCTRPATAEREREAVSEVAPAPAAAGAAPAADWHDLYSFVDNRHLAHVGWRGGLVLLAGEGGFAKYLALTRGGRSAWTLAQRQDDRKVARLGGKATLAVPVFPADAPAARAVSLSVHASKAGRLSLRVDGGKRALTASLTRGWQVIELMLPAPLAAGEHAFELDARGVALEWLHVGPPGVLAGQAPARPTAAGLPLGGDATFTYVMHVPAKTARVSPVRLDDGCTLVITAAATGLALDLGVAADAVTAVRLGARCPRQVVVPRLALEQAGLAPRPYRAAPPKVVVFWIMDTLRYDRVPLWFPSATPAAETPTLSRLAKDGAVFLTHYPGGNESIVSHASMFTGQRPGAHRIVGGVKGFDWKFQKAWTTLGEVARKAGLLPIGVTANGHIVRDAGYGHGFATYENPMAEGKHEPDYGYSGERVLARLLELAAKQKDQPLFLFAGTIDTHVPWRAHEPWVSRYDAANPQPYRGKFQKVATAGGIKVSFMLSRTPPPPRDAERLRAIYASDVSYQDALVGKLLDQLATWGLLEQTMVIVTADHGEEFWEHGIAGHGGSMREAVVHTPLLIWYPPLVPAVRVEQGTEGIDLLATVADVLGVALPAEAQGASLVSLAQGVGAGYPAPAITSHWEQAHAMRLGRWKLSVPGRGAPRLTDAVGDPEERKDLAASSPLELRFVRDAMGLARVYELAWRKQTWGHAANMTAVGAAALETP